MCIYIYIYIYIVKGNSCDYEGGLINSADFGPLAETMWPWKNAQFAMWTGNNMCILQLVATLHGLLLFPACQSAVAVFHLSTPLVLCMSPESSHANLLSPAQQLPMLKLAPSVTLPLSLSLSLSRSICSHFGSSPKPFRLGCCRVTQAHSFGSRGAMGSKAQLEDIQRLLQNLHRQLGSDRLGGGRQGKAQDRGTKVGLNWDCPHCADGIDNFASRTRCFKCGGNRTKNGETRQANPKQAPRARSRPPKPSDRAPSATPGPKVEAIEVDSTQEDAVSELATARSLYEWARKLLQPARDKELPAARKRFELAEGEDKKRKPPAERLQSALSRVDHRTRQAQAARDAFSEAQQALEGLEAECLHQDALLAKDQEELQVAQSLHQAWGPAAREGAGAPSRTQPAPDPALATGLAGRAPEGSLQPPVRSSPIWPRPRTPQGTGRNPGVPVISDDHTGGRGKPGHPSSRPSRGVGTKEGAKARQDQVPGALRTPGRGHPRGRGPQPQRPQWARRDAARASRRGGRRGRSRTVVNRAPGVGRFAVGVILWLVASPSLGYGFKGGHSELQGRVHAHACQQMKKRGHVPDLRGALVDMLEGRLALPSPEGSPGKRCAATAPGEWGGGGYLPSESSCVGMRGWWSRRTRPSETLGGGDDPWGGTSLSNYPPGWRTPA